MSEAEDIALIVNLINAYAVAVDTDNIDLFDRIFTEDAVVGFGPGVEWTDRAALKAAFEVIHAPFAGTQHFTTNHHVVVNGDSASAYSYVHGYFIAKTPGPDNMFHSTGWYEDRLVRTAAGWRIAERKSRMVWAGGNLKVLEDASGVKADQSLDSPKAEFAAGKMPHVALMKGD